MSKLKELPAVSGSGDNSKIESERSRLQLIERPLRDGSMNSF